MERRDALKPEQDAESIDLGISELLRAGTVAIGEVTNSLRSVELLASAPLLGRVFHEVFGLRRETADVMIGLARQTRSAIAHWPTQLGYALSPHTLYSLAPESVCELVDEVQRTAGRTSLHLAEHAAERAFLRDGTGPFADFLQRRKVPASDFVPPGLSPVDYAAKLGVLRPDVIAVHLCATEPRELARVRAANVPVVLCPRSNLFIELKLPPLFDILEAGIEPGLGTDSLASNTTLDVLAEAAALSDRFPRVEPGKLLTMATWYGARALGLSHRVGALRVGLSPGLLAFDLRHPVADPLRYLLRSPPPSRRVLQRPSLPLAGETLEDMP
jgi:cytosine/adenosine deaminase-related metal-dependent hydrolase